MKRTIIFTSMIAAFVAMTFTSACKSSKSTTQVPDGKTYITEGWNQEGTAFYVKAVGIAKEEKRDGPRWDAIRGKQSRSAALLDAQGRVIQLLTESTIQGAAGSLDGVSTGEAITKEYGGLLKGGEILQETYGPKKEVCEAMVVFRVNRKDVETSARKAQEK